MQSQSRMFQNREGYSGMTNSAPWGFINLNNIAESDVRK